MVILIIALLIYIVTELYIYILEIKGLLGSLLP
jgi:hypothetical protein